MTILHDRHVTRRPNLLLVTAPGGVSQLIAFAASTYSLLAVWLMVIGLTTAATWPSMFFSIRNDQLVMGVPERPIVYGLVLLACIAAWYASFPLARFCVRLFPIKTNGKRRPGLIVLAVVLGASWLSVSFMLVRDTFILLVPMTVLVVAALVWMLYWHIRAARLLDTPFILFLRRFSTFSDRSVLSTLLATRPPGYRTAFLVAPFENPANFSPVLVAFAGTSLVRPLEACPVPLHARDIEWEDHVEDLARQASCIVIDLSDPSPAIAREIDIVRAVASPDRIVLLRDNAADRHVGLASIAVAPESARPCVRYSRSWRSAIRRIVLETLALGMVGLVVASFVAGNAALPEWVPWLLGLLLIVLGAPAIMQPNVDRQAHRSIQLGVRQALAGKPKTLATRRDAGRDRCAIIGPPIHAAGHQPLLSEAARAAEMEPSLVNTATKGRAMREAIQLIRNAAVVVGDISTPDQDVDYLLGVAHGLGRRVVLVSASSRETFRGVNVQHLASGSESRIELTRVLDEHRRDPLRRGPVADLLADEWVFGDRFTWRRLAAFVVDLSIGAALVAGYVAWASMSVSTMNDWVITGEIALLVFAAVRCLTLALTGTTPGMALAGLHVIDADGGRLRLGQAAGRSAAALLAWLPFSGYLFMFFAPRYQALEDALSNTLVVRGSP